VFRKVADSVAFITSHDAGIVGTDPNRDPAVLAIGDDDDRLHPLEWGDSSDPVRRNAGCGPARKREGHPALRARRPHEHRGSIVLQELH
jgi:hypothetical protein